MQGGDPMRRFTTTEGAREQGTKGAGERGSRKADKFFSLAHSLTRSLALLRDGGAGGGEKFKTVRG